MRRLLPAALVAALLLLAVPAGAQTKTKCRTDPWTGEQACTNSDKYGRAQGQTRCGNKAWSGEKVCAHTDRYGRARGKTRCKTNAWTGEEVCKTTDY